MYIKKIFRNYRWKVIRNIDTSVQDWIKEIENEIKGIKKNHCAKEKVLESGCTGVIAGHTELKFMKEITKIIEFVEMKCSF